MERVRLGRTSVEVTPIGIGTGAWGNQSTWGFGDGYGGNDVKQAFEASIAAGIDFYDTAEVYGDGIAETLLGEALATVAGKDLVVTTKFMPNPDRKSKQDFLQALRKSLLRLHLPSVDLYQIHMPLPPSPVDEWALAAREAVDLGLIRAIGVSNFDAEETRRMHDALARQGLPLASNQVRYNVLFREIETNGVADACRELGVTIIAYAPIGQGLLTGKYGPDNPPPLARHDRYAPVLHKVPAMVEALRRVGQAHGGKTAPQVALNWLIAKGAVPIPGAKNASQAGENAGAMGWQLTAEEVALLDSIQ